MKWIRITLFVLGAWGAFFFPPWFPAACIVLLSIRFRAWEAILLGLLVDMLWLGSGTGFHEIPLFTLGAIAAVWLLEPVRSEFLLT